MEKVKGFNKLTKEQQDLFINVHSRRIKGVGHEYKDDWTPISVEPLGKNLKVVFKNGEWLHYTPNYDWY